MFIEVCGKSINVLFPFQVVLKDLRMASACVKCNSNKPKQINFEKRLPLPENGMSCCGLARPILLCCGYFRSSL